MGSADIARGKSTSTCLVAQSIESREDAFESTSLERTDVFDEGEAGRGFFDDAGILEPQSRALAIEAGAQTRIAQILAGEAPAHEVDVRRVKRSHVDVPEHAGPVPLEHAAAPRVELALVVDLAARHQLDGQIEQADRAEERADAEARHVRGFHPNTVTPTILPSPSACRCGLRASS